MVENAGQAIHESTPLNTPDLADAKETRVGRLRILIRSSAEDSAAGTCEHEGSCSEGCSLCVH